MNKSRQGKHKAGSVRMGVYTSPFRKAVALILARECGMSLTDVIWHGIESLAIGKGIITSNGEVTAEFKEQIEASLEIVKQSEVNG
jgi:hypothetical protein